jgi:hypothetical protein
MMTRLILHTLPWSTLAMPALFIIATPTATASPLVVMMTTSSSTSMPDSNLRAAGQHMNAEEGGRAGTTVRAVCAQGIRGSMHLQGL